MKLPITAIILTYNEELNIAESLLSISDWVEEIIIIDSFSTDKTIDIAKKYECRYFERKFVNQAEQFNWALDNVQINNEWILRLDSDEIMLPETWKEIAEHFKSEAKLKEENIAGFYMKRRVYFMNRWIRHGGYYPAWFLRLWRKDSGRYEDRAMDEHVILKKGKTINLENDFEEHDRKNLSIWIEKHNKYAEREATSVLEKSNNEITANREGSDPERRRWYKDNLYYRLPPFFRALLYWKYRYIIRLGVLDGIPGLIWHFLQGFWYRFLVDAKIYELRIKKLTKSKI